VSAAGKAVVLELPNFRGPAAGHCSANTRPALRTLEKMNRRPILLIDRDGRARRKASGRHRGRFRARHQAAYAISERHAGQRLVRLGEGRRGRRVRFTTHPSADLRCRSTAQRHWHFCADPIRGSQEYVHLGHAPLRSRRHENRGRGRSHFNGANDDGSGTVSVIRVGFRAGHAARAP